MINASAASTARSRVPTTRRSTTPSAASYASATCAATAWRTAKRRPACRRAPTGRSPFAWSITRASWLVRRGPVLPGAPDPEHTLPTTQYKTQRALPSNLRRRLLSPKAEHSHPPLVLMLTLTQLSVGAFVVAGAAHGRWAEAAPALHALMPWRACRTGASVLHLGRPLFAYRAVLNLRTSWLSREALVFGLFVQLAIVYGALVGPPRCCPLGLRTSPGRPCVARSRRAGPDCSVFSAR